MNVNKYSFTKYIDFWFFQFLHKRKSFTRLATKKYFKNESTSLLHGHLLEIRNGLSDFLLTVLSSQLEISKQLKPEKKWNSCNLFSPLDNILLELLKSNRGNEEKSSRMVKKGIKVFRADLPTNLSENSYWIDLGQGNK